MKTTKLHELIDRQIEIKQDSGFRNHLGASIIGRQCARQIWYTFHWMKRVRHSARLLRLFDRGNLEESRFVGWLRRAGIQVLDADPETGKQFRILDHEDHFGGSLDAMMRDVPDWPNPDEWLNGEFKTHSSKSFTDLVKKKVQAAKPEHYVQMQIYMHKTGMPAAIYMAINKDNDDLYTEIVMYDRATAERYLDRAGKIIAAGMPPERISETPSYYICRWCDFQDVCHEGAPPAHNCRSCVHSRPVADAGWLCTKFNYPLSEEDQRRGCQVHTPY